MENVEVTTINTPASKKTASKKNASKKNKKQVTREPKVGGLLAQARARYEETQRLNSIFLELEAGKPTIALIKGIGFREQEFKQGPSMVIDIKLETEDHRIKVTGVPEFARAPFRDMLTILEKYNVDPSEIHPLGTRANLKTYKWTATKDIPIIINPTKVNERLYIGSIKEIPIDVIEPDTIEG